MTYDASKFTRTVTVTISVRAAEYLRTHAEDMFARASERAEIWAKSDNSHGEPNAERQAHWAASAASWAADEARLGGALSRAAQPAYEFAPYDVLQVKASKLDSERRPGLVTTGEWLDYCALRTEGDGRAAVSKVDAEPERFRIVRDVPTIRGTVVYAGGR